MTDLHAHHADAREDPDIHHETLDVNINGVLTFAAGLLVAAVLIHLIVWVLFGYFDAREARGVAPEYPLAIGQARVPPEPRLQPNPREDLRELLEREALLLGSYGWVDRNAGIVRIPIGEAMKLTVQRGLPARRPAGEQR